MTKPRKQSKVSVKAWEEIRNILYRLFTNPHTGEFREIAPLSYDDILVAIATLPSMTPEVQAYAKYQAGLTEKNPFTIPPKRSVPKKKRA